MKLFIYIAALWILSLTAAQTPATRVADLVGGKYIGGNKLTGQAPSGYEKFLVMWVDDPGICRPDLHVNYRQNYLPDPAGRISICGRVVFQGIKFPKGDSVADGKYLSYEFKEAYLFDLRGMPVRLQFVTQTIAGVSFRFNGSYLETPNETDAAYLEGKMSKLVNGQLESETKLRFAPFFIIE